MKGPPQATHGTIKLKLPSPAAAAERLARLQGLGAFEGTRFALSAAPQAQAGAAGRHGDAAVASGDVAVTCPWGQRFLLVAAAPGFPWPAGIVELRLPCFTGG